MSGLRRIMFQQQSKKILTIGEKKNLSGDEYYYGYDAFFGPYGSLSNAIFVIYDEITKQNLMELLSLYRYASSFTVLIRASSFNSGSIYFRAMLKSLDDGSSVSSNSIEIPYAGYSNLFDYSVTAEDMDSDFANIFTADNVGKQYELTLEIFHYNEVQQ